MIPTLPLADLVIPPERQRREFDAIKIQELADKIYALGLLHPIVVRNDGHTLVAGERRVKAIQHLAFLGRTFRCGGDEVPVGHLPIVPLGDLSPTDVFEAELTENVLREDLTWQEKAEAMAKLAELRGMQKGEAVTAAELAEEVHGRSDGRYQDDIRKSLIIANHLDNPALRGVKNLQDAFKILKMDVQKKELAEAGARLPSEILRERHRLLIGDFREMDLPVNSFSVSITDPPYGIDADDFGVSPKTTSGHTYSDPRGDEWKKLMWDIATTLWSVGTEHSHHYLFCDFARFQYLKELWEGVGFRVWSVPFIMSRTTSVRAPWQECGPWRAYECILYAMKGRRVCNLFRTDVLQVRGDTNLGHGAQKPVEAYVDLLQRSVRPGDRVIDLCCGTGTIFPAAQTNKVEATGIELIPQNAAIAAKRLEELK